MQDFRALDVWRKSHQITLEIYRLTAAFPPSERYGLASQLRRSAASVPSNIAEGCGRRTDSDFARFLHHAMGSANETDYQLLLARDLGYLETEDYNRVESDLVRVKRMLNGLIRRLRR